MKHTLTEIVKGTTAKLTHVCNGLVYYSIDVDGTLYQLEINSMDRADWANIYIYPEYKAITLMRWIRDSINKDDGKFIQLN